MDTEYLFIDQIEFNTEHRTWRALIYPAIGAKRWVPLSAKRAHAVMRGHIFRGHLTGMLGPCMSQRWQYRDLVSFESITFFLAIGGNTNIQADPHYLQRRLLKGEKTENLRWKQPFTHTSEKR